MNPTTLLFSSKHTLIWMDVGDDGSSEEFYRHARVTFNRPVCGAQELMENLGQLFLPILVARESLSSMTPCANLRIIAGRRYSIVIRECHNRVIFVVGTRGHVYLSHYANIVGSILDFLCGPFEKLMDNQITFLRPLLREWRSSSNQNIVTFMGGISQPLHCQLSKDATKKLASEFFLHDQACEILLLRSDEVQVLLQSDPISWVDSVHNFLIPLILRSVPENASLCAILRDRGQGHPIPAIIKRIDLHEELTLFIVENALRVHPDLRTLTRMAYQISSHLDQAESSSTTVIEGLLKSCQTLHSIQAQSLEAILHTIHDDSRRSDHLGYFITQLESQLSNCFSELLAAIPHHREEIITGDKLASLKRIMMATPTTNLKFESKRIHPDVFEPSSKCILRDNHVLTTKNNYVSTTDRGTKSQFNATHLFQNPNINIVKSEPNLLILQLEPYACTIYAWLEDERHQRICPMSAQVQAQIISRLKSQGGIITFCPVRMVMTETTEHPSVFHVQYLLKL